MRPQLLVLGALAAGCQGGPSDITVSFRLVDHTGAPTDAAMECGTDTFGIPVDIPAEVEQVEVGSYTCTLAEEVATFWATADTGAERAELSTSTDRPDLVLVLWRPAVAIVEVDGRVEVSWDPAPAGIDPDARTELTVTVSPVIGDRTVDAAATSWSFLAEDLEDFAGPAVAFHVAPQGGGATTDQWVEPIGFAHTPVVPLSRGAACAITDPADVSFPAGECPLTDGSPGVASCGDGCQAKEGIVDLGAVVPIRRIRVLGWGSRVAISSDGVDYTTVPENEELPQPTTARYVWSYDATSLGEISVFAP